jgi:hypothetical protein
MEQNPYCQIFLKIPFYPLSSLGSSLAFGREKLQYGTRINKGLGIKTSFFRIFYEIAPKHFQ